MGGEEVLNSKFQLKFDTTSEEDISNWWEDILQKKIKWQRGGAPHRKTRAGCGQRTEQHIYWEGGHIICKLGTTGVGILYNLSVLQVGGWVVGCWVVGGWVVGCLSG